MLITNTVTGLKKHLSGKYLSDKSIGLVPTMGALHAGHISLVKRSIAENDYTVVSIFINPTQFNNESDLIKYPRNLDQDIQLLERTGCDLIFTPSQEDIYTADELNTNFEFDFGGLDKVMEGKFRPGHFNGVVQIVDKFFQLINPDRAYFGEKDFQQLTIIHRLVELMHYDVQIIDCPIVREKSGLAMSSRNERLTQEQRKNAANISKVLFENRNFVPLLSPKELKEQIGNEISRITGLDLEYVEIANSRTLQPAKNWIEPTIACVAVYCGDVRLIDNIRCS